MDEEYDEMEPVDSQLTKTISRIKAPRHIEDIEFGETTEEDYLAYQVGNVEFTDERRQKLGQILEPCQVDQDCEAYPYFVCGILTPNQCGHKSVMLPELSEIAGLFTFAFVMALCTVAGIGGGGIAISLIIAFFKFTTKPAVAISSFTILVCTIMRFWYNFKSKNPEKPGMILLDYSLASVMMPTTLAGSPFGSFFFIIFPSLYI